MFSQYGQAITSNFQVFTQKPDDPNYKPVKDWNSLSAAEQMGEKTKKVIKRKVTSTDLDLQSLTKERQKIKRRGELQRGFSVTKQLIETI